MPIQEATTLRKPENDADGNPILIKVIGLKAEQFSTLIRQPHNADEVDTLMQAVAACMAQAAQLIGAGPKNDGQLAGDVLHVITCMALGTLQGILDYDAAPMFFARPIEPLSGPPPKSERH